MCLSFHLRVPSSIPSVAFFSEDQLFVIAKSYARAIASNNLESLRARPKLKRASSSLLSSQAKKCKEKQRERDRCAIPRFEEVIDSRRQRDTAAC